MPTTQFRARTLTGLLAAALVLPLAGCAGDQTGEDTTDNNVTNTSPSPTVTPTTPTPTATVTSTTTPMPTPS